MNTGIYFYDIFFHYLNVSNNDYLIIYFFYQKFCSTDEENVYFIDVKTINNVHVFTLNK